MSLSREEVERIEREFNEEHCLGPTDCEALLASHRELEREAQAVHAAGMRLSGLVTRLEAERDAARAELEGLEGVLDGQSRQIERAEAERDALREALEKLRRALATPGAWDSTNALFLIDAALRGGGGE